MHRDCLFCRISEGAEPAYFVGENDEALAFLDRRPANPGHSLVIPKVHSTDIFDMSARSSAGVFALVHQLAGSIQNAFGAGQALNILMSNGVAAEQSVFHAHVHLIPRKEGDGLAFVEGSPPIPSAVQFERVQSLLTTRELPLRTAH